MGLCWTLLFLHIEKSEDDERDLPKCNEYESSYRLCLPAVAACNAVRNCYYLLCWKGGNVTMMCEQDVDSYTKTYCRR